MSAVRVALFAVASAAVAACAGVGRGGQPIAASTLPSASRVAVANAPGEILFEDHFDEPGASLDTSRWTTELGIAARLGRTQLVDWISTEKQGEFRVGKGGAELALNTYNPSERSLLGTHAKTRMAFQPGNAGIELSARMKLPDLHAGIVYAIYFYGCPGHCLKAHDEIDIEITTTTLSVRTPRVQLNWFANEGSTDGHGDLVALPAGFDLMAEHEWRIRWKKARIDFYVDDVLLGSTTSHVPQGPMHATVIAWAPASTWTTAFSSTLQPVRSASANVRHAAILRSVRVGTF